MKGEVKRAGPWTLRFEVHIPEGVSIADACDYIGMFFSLPSNQVKCPYRERNDVIRSMSSDDTLIIRVPE